MGFSQTLCKFKIENGEQNGVTTMVPYLLAENPISRYVKVNANDSSVVYHNGGTDINNPASEEDILKKVNMNIETNIDTNDTFYFTDGPEDNWLRNEFFGTKRIQKGKKLEKLIQMGSDPRNYDAMVVSEAKGQYIGDMKNIVFPEGMGEDVYVHDFFNPKISKTLDTTYVKFRYDSTVGVNDDPRVPMEFRVSQNYPNPFNSTTTIKYNLPKLEDVTVDVYNSLGQKIRSLYTGGQLPGEHEIKWDGKNDDGKNVSSGVYITTVRAGEYFDTKKMVLAK